MYQIVLFIHVIIAIILIGIILIQQGKGATMGAAFGSGASQTVFGSQGSGSFLLKLTGSLAAAFFATSLILGYIAAREAKLAQRVSMTAPVSQKAPVNQEQKPASEKK